MFPESATQPPAYYFDALLFKALRKGCLIWGSRWKWSKSLGLAPSCPCLSFGLPEGDVIWTHGNLLFQWDSVNCPLLGCSGLTVHKLSRLGGDGILLLDPLPGWDRITQKRLHGMLPPGATYRTPSHWVFVWFHSHKCDTNQEYNKYHFFSALDQHFPTSRASLPHAGWALWVFWGQRVSVWCNIAQLLFSRLMAPVAW